MIWRSSYHRRVAQILDFAVAFISFIAAYAFAVLLHKIVPLVFPPKVEIRESYLILVLFLSFVYVLLFDIQKAYNYQRFTSLFREYSIIVKVCFTGLLISIAAVFLVGLKDFPRTILIVLFLVTLVLFGIEKTLLF